MRDNFILQVLEVSDSNNPTEIYVNDESKPTLVSNQNFEGMIKVRVRNYDGLPVDPNSKESLNKDSIYFKDNNYQYSIEFQGNFKSPSKEKYFKGNDILFGNQFDKKLRLPPFTSIGIKFITWYDPGLQIDLYSDKPKAFSPLIVTYNKLSIKHNQAFDPKSASIGQIGEEVRKVEEDCTQLNYQFGDHATRRKDLANKKKLQEVKIYSDTLVQGDFFNEYIDFSARGIKLPMITVNVMKYWDNQPLDYVCKGKIYNDQGEEFDEVIFFIVRIHLVEIEKAFQEIKPEVKQNLVGDIDVD